MSPPATSALPPRPSPSGALSPRASRWTACASPPPSTMPTRHSADDTRNGVDFDLDPGDGVLAIGEIGYSWNQPVEQEAEGARLEAHQPVPEGDAPVPACRAVKVGALYESGNREDLKDENNKKDGSPGFYVSLQQMVYREGAEGGTGSDTWAVHRLPAAPVDQRDSRLLRRGPRLQGADPAARRRHRRDRVLLRQALA